MQRREIVRTAAYHSHPHWQRTEWLRWGFSISFLHTAHNLIHITWLPILPGDFPPERHFPVVYRFPRGKLAPFGYFPILPLTLPIPVQRSQPNLAENPAVGPQKPLLMSLKSVVIAKLL